VDIGIDQNVHRVLDLARHGAYRKDIIEMLRGYVSYKEVNSIISAARQQGMYSVASERCLQRGTYYQYDG